MKSLNFKPTLTVENKPRCLASGCSFALDKALLDREINKEAADMKFFETLVRIHRAGEGAGFTGLKPAGAVEPAVAKADEAIEKGSVDELASEISGVVLNGIKERFKKVKKAKKHVDESVEAGREYVEAYIDFVHYVDLKNGYKFNFSDVNMLLTQPYKNDTYMTDAKRPAKNRFYIREK